MRHVARFPSVVRWSTWSASRCWIFGWGQAAAPAPARDDHIAFYFFAVRFELRAMLAIRCIPRLQPLQCGTHIPLPESRAHVVEWALLRCRKLRDHSHFPYLFPLHRFRPLRHLCHARWVPQPLLLFFWTPSSLGWVARPLSTALL
jgi:hypothetical protein